MRITARQLRQIIKEELTRGIREADETSAAVVAMGQRPKYGEEDPKFLKSLNDAHSPLVRRIVSEFGMQLRDGALGPFKGLDTDRALDSEYLKEMFESNSDVLLALAVQPIGFDIRGHVNFPEGQWLNGVINDAVKVITRSGRQGVRNEVQPVSVTARNILARLDSALDAILSSR